MPQKLVKGRKEFPGAASTSPAEIIKERIYQDIEERRLKEWENYQRSHRSAEDQKTNRAFLDISIGDVLSGRLVLELFDREVPVTVRRFRELVTGSGGVNAATNMKLDFLYTTLGRVDKEKKLITFGDLSCYGVSTGSHADENFSRRHTERGLLTMMSRGPNTSDSCFGITLGSVPSLDFCQVVFGKVIDGKSILEKFESIPINAVGRPLSPVVITFCGVLTGERPPGMWVPPKDVDQAADKEECGSETAA